MAGAVLEIADDVSGLPSPTWTAWLLVLLIATWVLVCAGCGDRAPAAPTPPARQLGPAPDLEPEEVVEAQLELLRTNAADNHGIAGCFAFASPANRESVGPLDRFIELLRSDSYRIMLNHADSAFGPLTVSDDRAQVPVEVTGSDGVSVVFVFLLSRQGPGPYRNCWMTDAVYRLPTSAPSADQPPSQQSPIRLDRPA